VAVGRITAARVVRVTVMFADRAGPNIGVPFARVPGGDGRVQVNLGANTHLTFKEFLVTSATTSSSSTGGSPSSSSTSGSALETTQGKTTIADAVVSKVAGLAAREIPGVHGFGGGASLAYGGHSPVAQPGLGQVHRPATPLYQDRRRQTLEYPAQQPSPRDRGQAHHQVGTADGDPPNGTASGEMIRSEEELHSSTETVITGKVRMRKHVVTEYRTITVAVSHDEVTLEWVPLTDPDQAAAGSEAPKPAEQHTPGEAHTPDQRHYMILYAEEPVITVETVARERAWIAVTTVHGHQQVSGSVRKECLETDIG